MSPAGMRLARRALALLSMGLGGLLGPVEGAAQPLGTFHWRLEPFCNTLVLTVTQEGAAYRLQGYEDQCADERTRLPVEGTAVFHPGLPPNRDPAFELGLSIDHRGESSRVSAFITDLSGLNGRWFDSYREGALTAVLGVSRSSSFPERLTSTTFVHVTEDFNSINNITCFSHPLTDGNPDAVIVFAHDRGVASEIRPAVNSIVSLYFDDDGTGLPGFGFGNNVWCLSRNDSAPMPPGAGFRIRILPRER
jgi:hypothetical protein